MRKLFIFIAALAIFSSCKIFKPSLMLKTPKDFNYDKLIDSLGRVDYKIAPNDAILYRVFTNDGFKLIDLASANNNVFRSDIDAIVESDGMVKMPLIGRMRIAGMSIIEAEKLMEDKYSEYYVKPFVTLRVNNKRVIVFPGSGGTAKVIGLANNNTTVLEAIASVGGLPEDGKAYKIKLIRNNPAPEGKPLVYLMDLSRIEGLTLGKSKVQANDIIYVEQRYRPLKTFNNEIAPIIGLLTSLLILYQFSKLR
ncbi:MAG: polysaccharide biosynthesis/export family protein [Bacteroidetes bacterium]|nr:polysaccharide biosynthesis/export family protein [Bacteroidota bacterium]